MDRPVIEAVGLLAGTLTTLAFLPQVLKTWRTKRTDDLSLSMLVSFATGVALWLVYGLLIRSLPVILSNVITLLLALVLVAFKLRRTDAPSGRRSGPRNGNVPVTGKQPVSRSSRAG